MLVYPHFSSNGCCALACIHFILAHTTKPTVYCYPCLACEILFSGLMETQNNLLPPDFIFVPLMHHPVDIASFHRKWSQILNVVAEEEGTSWIQGLVLVPSRVRQVGMPHGYVQIVKFLAQCIYNLWTFWYVFQVQWKISNI